jgi:hypothetical protein
MGKGQHRRDAYLVVPHELTPYICCISAGPPVHSCLHHRLLPSGQSGGGSECKGKLQAGRISVELCRVASDGIC